MIFYIYEYVHKGCNDDYFYMLFAEMIIIHFPWILMHDLLDDCRQLGELKGYRNDELNTTALHYLYILAHAFTPVPPPPPASEDSPIHRLHLHDRYAKWVLNSRMLVTHRLWGGVVLYTPFLQFFGSPSERVRWIRK